MIKSLQIPIRGLLAVAFLLTAAPALQAAHASVDRGLSKSVLKKCYQKSDDGDAGDLYEIIRKALEANPDQGLKLVENLIEELQDNRDQLHDGVSEKDLKRILKKLKKWVRSHRKDGHGPISPPTSGTTSR